MAKVSQEVATAEIEKWLQHKNVSTKKRESFADSIDNLIGAVMDGDLRLDENFHLVQTLKTPVGEGDAAVKELKFKPRLKVGTIHKHLQGVKPSDADGRLIAYVAALTSCNKGVVEAMDTDDFSIGQAIAVFFL